MTQTMLTNEWLPQYPSVFNGFGPFIRSTIREYHDFVATPVHEVITPASDPILNGSENNINSKLPELLMCGICEKPAHIHTNHEFYDSTPGLMREFCNRSIYNWTPLNTPDTQDYYLHDSVNHSSLSLADDYSGPGVMDRTNEYPYEDYEPELDALDRWTDKFPDEHTSAQDWWYYKKGTTEILAQGSYSSKHAQSQSTLRADSTTETRNAYVEGLDGFLATEIINLGLTEKYQNHLLNLYIDKRNGNLRCGSVEITHDSHTVTATCVNSKCYVNIDGNYKRNTVAIEIASATREDMEQFTYSVISHGNNHAASWFVNRPTFYVLPPVLPEATPESSDGETVMDHLRICKRSDCNCTTIASKVA